MDELKLFIPITKVDAAKRIVYGVATAELPDVSKEICDYATTKPFYQKWSENFSKTTDGKSLGNLRVMHGPVAAGKLTDIVFDDDAKKIEIAAKVVDDDEWKKVTEGVYTGFSQGGKYIKRWKDGDFTRYTADPVEVSLVDSPCLPEATFQIVKVDGSTEMRKFVKADPATRSEAKAAHHDEKAKEHAEAANRAVAGSAAAKAHRHAADEHGKAADMHRQAGAEYGAGNADAGDKMSAEADDQSDKADDASDEADDAAKSAGANPDWEQVWVSKRLPDKTFATKAALAQALIDLDATDAAKKSAAPVLDQIAVIKEKLGIAKTDAEGKQPSAGDGTPVAKRDFADDERKKLAASGAAMKDGSYPIETRSDLENAVHAFGRAKNKAAVKRHIIKRAKALKATDLLPADWPGSTQKKDGSKKIAGDGDLGKAASLWSVSDLLQLLASIECAEDNAELPSSGFGSSVDLPKELCDRFGSALVELGDIAAQMLDTVLSSIKEEEASEAVANAALASDLVKLFSLRSTLAKAGAKHSKADKERIKKAHDLLTEIDPDSCPAGDGEGSAEKLAKQIVAERAANDKLLNETILPVMTELATKISAIGDTVRTIADQPLPMGTSSVRVIEKSDDNRFNSWADQMNAPGGQDPLDRLASVAQRRAAGF